MRILVGTLYTIENEFDECVASIERQSYRDFEHLVLRNLGNKEAHESLFNIFVERSGEFDLLVKVDADMVLCSEFLLAAIVERFEKNPVLEHLQIAVHDFFTDQLIMGMNVYRNSVRWDMSAEAVFVESSETIRSTPGRRVRDWNDLAPSAIHCKNPSLLQAFHFGVHKGVKVKEAVSRQMSTRAREHYYNIENTWHHFLRTDDVRLGLAALGGELALQDKFLPEHLDYSNPFVAQVFQSHEQWSNKQIKIAVTRLRLANGGLLPPEARLEYLDIGYARTIARRAVPQRIRSWLIQLLKRS